MNIQKDLLSLKQKDFLEFFENLPEKYKQLVFVIGFCHDKEGRKYLGLSNMVYQNRKKKYDGWCKVVNYYLKYRKIIEKNIATELKESQRIKIRSIILNLMCNSTEIGKKVKLSGQTIRKFYISILNRRFTSRFTNSFLRETRKIIFGRNR